MSFGRSILSNRHAVWALALAAAIFGAWAYIGMPMQLFPDTSPPVVNVITGYPGASADDVTAELSRPLEEEFASLEGIINIRSTSQDSLSLVSLEFDYDRDVELAAVDVQNAIARIRGQLPSAISEPRVLAQSTSDRPIITVGLTADRSVVARRLAEDVVGPRLQRIPGVAAVDVFGGSEEAVLVEVDADRLEAYVLDPAQVTRTLREHNAALPAGELRTAERRHTFRLDARAQSLDDLALLPVSGGDSRVLLGDIARIEAGTLDDDARFRINGVSAIAVQVFKTENANTVEVVAAVLEDLDALRADYPELGIIVGEESATFTQTSINNLLENVWQALLLASAIIFLFIGHLRASLVAVVSMPLSYGLTFVGMRLAGVQFDLVTLSAVILAVGMVVDASVVVLENITRRRDDDRLGPEDAAATGVDEIKGPVLAGAATTVSVLVPLLFLAGFIGKTFGPLALTLLIAFTSSVLVALVLVPVLTLYTAGRGWLDRVGEWIAWPFQQAMRGLLWLYLRLLRGALRFRWLTLIAALASVVVGVGLMRGQGMEVLPRMDGGSFFITIETPSGSSLESTEVAVRAIERILAEEEEVTTVQSQVGYERGMRYFASGSVQGPTQGFISVTLTARTEREENLWTIQDRMRDRIWAEVPSLRTLTVREQGNTAKSTTRAPIVIRLSGDDALVLDRLGEEVLSRVSGLPSVVEPVRTWRLDQRRLRVMVDALRAGRIGLSPAGVAAQMQAGSVGVPAGDYYGAGDNAVPILMRYSRSEMPEPEALLDYPVMLPATGATVPLRSVAALRETVSAGLMTREDLAPTLEITAVLGDQPLSVAVSDVEAALADILVPIGYTVELTGENDDLGLARREILGALLISVLAVYLLLVGQLRSFIHPLTIMLSVPLAIFGVAVALVVADKPVSMPVMVGLVLLVGIVVNSSIILIEYIRRAREAGTPRREAVLESVRIRFRPIMMTALSTIVGMIPLAGEWSLGAERFSPLAIAVIGGLTAATLLTLVVIPVLYDVFDDLAGAMRRLVRRRPRPDAAAVAGLALLLVWPIPAASQEAVPLDVGQSVALALDHDFGLEARSSEVAAAESGEAAAWSRFFPRFGLLVRYSRLSEAEPGTLAGGVSFGELITDVYTFRGQMDQPLFTGFALVRSHDLASQRIDLARARLGESEADVRLRVVDTYYRLYQARELRHVTRRSIALLERHLERVRDLHAAGRATSLDVARTETRLSRTRAQLLEEEGREATTQLAFATLLGLPLDTEIVLTEPPEAGLLAEPAPGGPLVSVAVVSRPELTGAREAARLEQTSVALAEAEYWPQLHLSAGYSMANPNDRYLPPVSEFNDSWDVTLNLTWTLWEGGGRSHRIEEARFRTSAAEARVAQLEEATRLAVEQIVTELEVARRSIAAIEESVLVAETALSEAQTLFDAGRVDSSEILERDLELAQVRGEHVSAQVDWRLKLTQLERLVGVSLAE